MSDTQKIYDIGIIGGGIVGLATAYQINKLYPQASIVITEKENRVAAHQTGHNSGVLHSGIYYRPGSLRATNCREGKVAMEQFCREQGVAFDVCGKVIVAVNESEIPAMQKIYERGQENGVQCEIINEKRLKELEPQVMKFRRSNRSMAISESVLGHRSAVAIS